MSENEKRWLPVCFIAQMALAVTAVALVMHFAAKETSSLFLCVCVVAAMPLLVVIPSMMIYERHAPEPVAWLYVMLPSALSAAVQGVVLALTAQRQPDGSLLLFGNGAVSMVAAALCYGAAAVLVPSIAVPRQGPLHPPGLAAGMDDAEVEVPRSRDGSRRGRPGAV